MPALCQHFKLYPLLCFSFSPLLSTNTHIFRFQLLITLTFSSYCIRLETYPYSQLLFFSRQNGTNQVFFKHKQRFRFLAYFRCISIQMWKSLIPSGFIGSELDKFPSLREYRLYTTILCTSNTHANAVTLCSTNTTTIGKRTNLARSKTH